MYFPYVRTYFSDLDALTERRSLISASRFIPVIEPIEPYHGRLLRALGALDQAGVECVLIVNPGLERTPPRPIDVGTMLEEQCAAFTGIRPGVCVTPTMSLDEIVAQCSRFSGRELAIVHKGYGDAKALADTLRDRCPDCTHLFHERQAGRLYRNQFDFGRHVLIRDGRKPFVVIPIGFWRYKDPVLPQTELFSDLHLTFKDEGASGFGDWANVGDEWTNMEDTMFFNHFCLTRIDAKRCNEMWLHRFEHRERALPSDEATRQSMQQLAEGEEGAPFRERPTQAVTELIEQYRSGNRDIFRMRKFSVAHHFECMAQFLGGRG